MITLRFVCVRCGYEFEERVFEPGEAEEKQVSTRPIRCSKCGGSVKAI